MKKYAVHEGFVNSKNDGDRHFISFSQLCQLYRINPKDAVNWVQNGRGRTHEDYVHLYPNYDGDYRLPHPDQDSKGE